MCKVIELEKVRVKELEDKFLKRAKMNTAFLNWLKDVADTTDRIVVDEEVIASASDYISKFFEPDYYVCEEINNECWAISDYEDNEVKILEVL